MIPWVYTFMNLLTRCYLPVFSIIISSLWLHHVIFTFLNLKDEGKDNVAKESILSFPYSLNPIIHTFTQPTIPGLLVGGVV